MKKNNPSLLTLQEINDAYFRGDITYRYACSLMEELGLRPEYKLTFLGKLKVYVRKVFKGKEKLNVVYLKDYKRKI